MGRFVRGSVVVVNYFLLRKDSFIRPNILNTVDSSRILYSLGALSLEKIVEVDHKLRKILGI